MLIVLVFLVNCSSGTQDEPETNDDDEADYEFGYNPESVVQDTNPPEDESGNGGVETPEPENINTGVVLVTGAQAREIFESDDAVILLDVRNQDEHDEYHIVGSVLIPVDELESRLSELPDKDAVIIVFCRAGRRSAIASEVLASNGYTNVHDMQGIDNW